MIVATILLALAAFHNAYWPMVFPAFIIGSTGATLVCTHANIALFRATPPSMAGTVGAVFNGAMNLGAAIGLAAATSIEVSVEKKSISGIQGHEVRAAAYWFPLGVVCIKALGVLVFYGRIGESTQQEQEQDLKLEGRAVRRCARKGGGLRFFIYNRRALWPTISIYFRRHTCYAKNMGTFNGRIVARIIRALDTIATWM